jgi:hypothetical protein
MPHHENLSSISAQSAEGLSPDGIYRGFLWVLAGFVAVMISNTAVALPSQTGNAGPPQTASASHPAPPKAVRLGDLEFWLSPPPDPVVVLDVFTLAAVKGGCRRWDVGGPAAGELDDERTLSLLRTMTGMVTGTSNGRSASVGVRSFAVVRADWKESSTRVHTGDPMSFCTPIDGWVGQSLMLGVMYDLVRRTTTITFAAVRIGSVPTGSQSSGDTEDAFWSLVKDSADPKQIRQYLNKYPSGRYREEAARTKNALESTKEPAVLYVLGPPGGPQSRAARILLPRGEPPMTIRLDGAKVTNISKGKFFGVKVSPGDHVISVNKNDAVLSAKAGVEYFLSVDDKDLVFLEREPALERGGRLQPVNPKDVKPPFEAVLALPAGK